MSPACAPTIPPFSSPALTITFSLSAFEKALRFGYRRPALIFDHITNGRFSFENHIVQEKLFKSQQASQFYLVNEAREKPDLILTHYNVVRDWIEALQLRIPNDVGLIQLEWRKDNPHWAGMNQHNDLVGEAAVEMAIHMIHNHPPSIPAFPLATLVGSTWINGGTIRSIL